MHPGKELCPLECKFQRRQLLNFVTINGGITFGCLSSLKRGLGEQNGIRMAVRAWVESLDEWAGKV